MLRINVNTFFSSSLKKLTILLFLQISLSKFGFSEEISNFNLTQVTISKGTPIEISSNSAIYDENKGFAVFVGDVRVGHGPYKIRGERLEIIFDVEDKNSNEPMELIFTDSVVFTNGFEIGKSEKANYYIQDGMIILEKDVMFKQGQSIFFGEKAEFDLDNGKMIFGGRINASISSNE